MDRVLTEREDEVGQSLEGVLKGVCSGWRVPLAVSKDILQ